MFVIFLTSLILCTSTTFFKNSTSTHYLPLHLSLHITRKPIHLHSYTIPHFTLLTPPLTQYPIPQPHTTLHSTPHIYPTSTPLLTPHSTQPHHSTPPHLSHPTPHTPSHPSNSPSTSTLPQSSLQLSNPSPLLPFHSHPTVWGGVVGRV